ncbi:MAG: DUF2809 domain-containing protein [Aeromonadaceae bacterium]
MPLGFYKRYALLALGLLLLELGIALFVHDQLIRPWIGDTLVVILLFALCRSVIRANHYLLALAVLLFAYAIEIGQYFNLVAQLGLEQNKLARVVIGATFDPHDLLAYTMGALLICLVQWSHNRFRLNRLSEQRFD